MDSCHRILVFLTGQDFLSAIVPAQAQLSGLRVRYVLREEVGIIGIIASGIKLNRGDNDASADANAPVCHLVSKALNFGSVPFKNLKQYFGAAVLPLQPLPDQKGCLRYVALLEATSVADMKVDEVAADHGHDFVPLAGELSRLGDFAEASISGGQILSRDQYATVRVAKTLQLRECETFDLGQILDVYGDQHPVLVLVLLARSLFKRAVPVTRQRSVFPPYCTIKST